MSRREMATPPPFLIAMLGRRALRSRHKLAFAAPSQTQAEHTDIICGSPQKPKD